MVNFHLLVKKMLKAIRIKYGQRILYGEEQKISEKTGRIYTEYKVSVVVTRDKYDELHPENPLNRKIYKSDNVSILLMRTIKIEELFLYLLNDIWNKLESGEMYEQGEKARERIRSRYGNKRGRGRGGRAGVLQDAPVSEELQGCISGCEQFGSGGESEGDTVEAGECGLHEAVDTAECEAGVCES